MEASPLCHPQPTHPLVPPPSLLLLLLPPAAASLPRLPPSTQHPAASTQHHELTAAAEAGKCRGKGKKEGAPSGIATGAPGTATRRESRSHPGHPRVPPTALPVPEGQRGTRLQLLPGSALVWMLFWGFSFLFSASNLWGCGFLLIPAWKTTGLDLLLLLPQEPGARSRDEGQGRRPSVESSIWGPEFTTDPTELPRARQDRGIWLPRVGALLVFPDTRCRSPSQVCWACLSFGTQCFTGVTLSPSLPSPQEPVPKPSQCLIPLHNDCVWVTFSNPSPLRPPATSAALAAPLVLSSPRGPQHRLGLINPRQAPECPSQPHVSHPPN